MSDSEIMILVVSGFVLVGSWAATNAAQWPRLLRPGDPGLGLVRPSARFA